MTKFIYIAGRGHSGSTMLDGMLGNASNIESVGELISGMGRYDSLCSCGETFRDCQYWLAIRERFHQLTGAEWDANVDSLVNQAHLKSFPETLLGSFKSKYVQRLIQFNQATADSIADNKVDYVVDSSKEITRALFLIRHLPRTKIIHLVKDPVSILESTFYRLEKGSGVRFLRCNLKPKTLYAPVIFIRALGWLVGNALAELVALYNRDGVLRIQYEDIIEDPVAVMTKLEQFLGVSLAEINNKLQSNESFDVGHNIGGNGMRMAKKFNFDPSRSSRRGMPARYRIMTKMICFPLMIRYGYFSR